MFVRCSLSLLVVSYSNCLLNIIMPIFPKNLVVLMSLFLCSDSTRLCTNFSENAFVANSFSENAFVFGFMLLCLEML